MTLKSKFEELESLININNLISAITHYTAQLKTCSTAEEKFLISQNFVASELKHFLKSKTIKAVMVTVYNCVTVQNNTQNLFQNFYKQYQKHNLLPFSI